MSEEAPGEYNHDYETKHLRFQSLSSYTLYALQL